MTKLEQKLLKLGYEKSYEDNDMICYCKNPLFAFTIHFDLEFDDEEIIKVSYKVTFNHYWFTNQRQIDNLQKAFNQLQDDLKELKDDLEELKNDNVRMG